MKDRLLSYYRHKARVLSWLRRLLWFSVDQRAYLRKLKHSGLFDREFYRRQNPQLLPVFLHLAERHYIAFGEQAGLFPCPDFSPAAYRRLNPQAAASGLPSFLHYIETGRQQQLLTRDPSPVDAQNPAVLPPVPKRSPRHELAVAIHIYYPELWPEIEQALLDSGLDLDWYITITDLGASHQDLAEEIRHRHRGATVLLMPNHGRDVFPWVYLINAGALTPYRAVCKLHTKRSPHLEDGASWRRGLLQGILSDRVAAVQKFLEDPGAGLLVSAGQKLSGTKWWGVNQARTVQILSKGGLNPDPNALEFAAGSMFWVKKPVIESIAKLKLAANDFEPEQGGTDGSTAHAFERALGYLVVNCGLKIRESDS